MVVWYISEQAAGSPEVEEEPEGRIVKWTERDNEQGYLMCSIVFRYGYIKLYHAYTCPIEHGAGNGLVGVRRKRGLIPGASLGLSCW